MAAERGAALSKLVFPPIERFIFVVDYVGWKWNHGQLSAFAHNLERDFGKQKTRQTREVSLPD
ncbi:MAG: hypothetical protein ACREMS_08815 [Gemmatimonadaceae bacterium]